MLALDAQLAGKRYFCGGSEVTVADLLYYNEISTIVTLTKYNLKPEEYPNLASWYNERMSTIPEVIALDKKLKEMITKYNIQ